MLTFAAWQLIRYARARKDTGPGDLRGPGGHTDVHALLPFPILLLYPVEYANERFGLAFWLVTLTGLGILGWLWSKGHDDLIDRPDPAGSPRRKFWNDHSLSHVIFASIPSLFITIFDGPTAGIVSAVTLGIAVEIAQRFPRDGAGGTVEWWDLWWDFAGGVAGAIVGGLLACYVFKMAWCQ